MKKSLYEKVRELCREKGITVSKLEIDLEFGRNSIQKWNITSPSVDKVVKVAAYFDVSVDYLLGVTDIKTPLSEILQDDDMIKLQRARQKMTSRDKEKMMMMLELGFEDAFSDENKGD